MNFSYYFWPDTPFSWSAVQGANHKRVFVICEDSEVAENLPFLKKVLRSVDMDFDQDVHFTLVSPEIKVQLLSDPQMQAYDHLILFGIRPSQIGITGGDKAGCSMFQFEKITCIAAPRLSELNSNADHKKQLWSALKHLFQPAIVQ